MTAKTPTSTQTLYDRDYLLWLEATVEQLRQEKFADLDRENLIEELESMVRSDKRAIKSLLTRLLEHLLKLAYWESAREYNANHWITEITIFRVQIQDLLADSPSLKPYLAEIFEPCYSDARKIITRSKKINISLIPLTSIPTLEQTLDDDWLPIVID